MRREGTLTLDRTNQQKERGRRQQPLPFASIADRLALNSAEERELQRLGAVLNAWVAEWRYRERRREGWQGGFRG
ncbi:hypothetical protein ACFSCW_03290 [Sphingomonas tabacisoli]|uniref:Uncharacterized protein n=1 Tax=Sphingomonas tabacisoli TaxID=2249466 RepID=A0ABW4I026_9SPHN